MNPPQHELQERELNPTAVALIAAAALCVGLAIHARDGEYTPAALGLVSLAIAATGWAVFSRIASRIPRRQVVAIAFAAIVVQFVALFTAWPGVDLPQLGGRQLLPFYVGLVVALAMLAIGATRPRNAAWFPLLLATHLALGAWMVRSSPNPHIDVWVFQQDASSELLKGRNPYTMTFPDIYHSTLPGYPQEVYGKGLVANDRVQFGFPYPPVSLYLATIGYAIAGDHRYAQAVALVLAGLFLGYARPGLLPKLAAALLLFTPRVFFILGRAWTEPFTVMLLAATVFLACRRSRLLPLALGLLLATKQYMVLAVPVTFFLLPAGWRWRDWLRLLIKSAAVAAIATLPLALWDYRAFWKSTVTVQELAPFRWDAISYLVWYGFRGHKVTEAWVALLWSTLAALAGLAIALRRAPRTPAGFAASLGLILLGFFAFNKQAFCNYYFFAIAALCAAVAAVDPDVARADELIRTPIESPTPV